MKLYFLSLTAFNHMVFLSGSFFFFYSYSYPLSLSLSNVAQMQWMDVQRPEARTAERDPVQSTEKQKKNYVTTKDKGVGGKKMNTRYLYLLTHAQKFDLQKGDTLD